MLKKIAIGLVVLIAAVLAYAATRPDSFRVERSVTIKAPPDRIYPMIDDFRQWTAWSPWEKLDPAMQRTFSGPPTGKGSAYAWQGNDKVGQGRMEILDNTAPSAIRIQLDFLKPMEGHNTTDFTLQPTTDGTHVTWAMYGPSNYVTKLMGVFFSMDSMIGKDFETGLANLKASAEK